MDKESVRALLLRSGAVAAGFAAASSVGEEVIADMEEWVRGGNNAGMDYLARHTQLKKDPGNTLPGVCTVISLAFSFNPSAERDASLPVIASYALGDDYHDVLRKRLAPIVESLRLDMGGDWRICIDSAPIAERYWAVRAGIGYIGRNGMVIVEPYGSRVFLAEVLTSIPFPPDKPASGNCRGCGRCVEVCPGNALSPDGKVDCRRCLSYLTIEHRGEWLPEMMETMHTPAGKTTLFGCDRCVSVCPHNLTSPPSRIEEFALRESYSMLTASRAASLKREEFTPLFKGSAIKRTKYDGFLRNALNLSIPEGGTSEKLSQQ